MNLTNLHSLVDGKKTYITIGIGMLAVLLNHMGWWPSSVPLTLDPSNWLNDEWTLFLLATGRSAISKVSK